MTDAIGLDINAMFELLAKNIETKGTALNEEMKTLASGDQLSDQQMLKIQFAVNTYNTILEMTSSISKSLLDEAKQLAQRAN